MHYTYLLKHSSIKRGFLKLVLSLLMISLIIIVSGCTNKEQVNCNFDTYLSGNTDFEKKVATVMPSKNELADSKIIYYVYYIDGDDISNFANSMIRLTVEYSDDNFLKAIQKIEELSKEYYNDVMGGQFYYNGVLYRGFQIYNNGYYALAYHICSNSSTISYIVFECDNLTYMDVGSALSLFPQIICDDQIVKTEDSSVS